MNAIINWPEIIKNVYLSKQRGDEIWFEQIYKQVKVSFFYTHVDYIWFFLKKGNSNLSWTFMTFNENLN